MSATIRTTLWTLVVLHKMKLLHGCLFFSSLLSFLSQWMVSGEISKYSSITGFSARRDKEGDKIIIFCDPPKKEDIFHFITVLLNWFYLLFFCLSVIPSTDVYQTLATMKRQFKIYFDFTLHTIPSDTVNLVHCTTGCNFGEKVNVSNLDWRNCTQ